MNIGPLEQSVAFGMGKFYAAAIAIFIVGIALYHFGTVTPVARSSSTIVFVGSALILTGAASFILAFGYHVRAASVSLHAGRDSDRL